MVEKIQIILAVLCWENVRPEGVSDGVQEVYNT